MSKDLVTKRLLLRYRSERLIKQMIENSSHAEQLAYFGYETRPELLDKELERLEQGYDNWKITFCGWDLILKDTKKVIGSCGYHSWYKPHLRAEIGYGLSDNQHKNKGYMTEAMERIIEYGFEDMGLNRIEAFVSPDNIPSVKLMDRFGFVKEGVLREHYKVLDDMMDSVAYALLKSEYRAKKT